MKRIPWRRDPRKIALWVATLCTLVLPESVAATPAPRAPVASSTSSQKQITGNREPQRQAREQEQVQTSQFLADVGYGWRLGSKVGMQAKVLYTENREHQLLDILAPGVTIPVEIGGFQHAAEKITAVLDVASYKRVKNLPIRVIRIELPIGSSAADRIIASGANVLYLTAGLGASLAAVVETARQRGLVTLTGVPEFVDLGVAVGISERQDKPEILINLASSRAEGSQFDASLLRLSRVRVLR